MKEIGNIVVLVIYTKIKRKKTKNQKHTYRIGVCLPLTHIDDVPLLEGERSMADEIFPIPDLYYKMKGRAILL